MDFLHRVKSVLLTPTAFFTKLSKEHGVKTAFFYLIFISFVGFVLATLVSPLSQSNAQFFASMFGQVVPPSTFGQIAVLNFVGFALGLLLSFVGAAILHVWILIWGGRAPYSKTYQLSVYSGTPGYILGWIPFVGMFAFIYWLALIIIGTQHAHKLSKTKSILMYILPVLLVIALLALLLGVAFYALSSLPVA